MDGSGRAFDNIFIERLWRSIKYEEVYLKDYADLPILKYSNWLFSLIEEIFKTGTRFEVITALTQVSLYSDRVFVKI